MKTVYIESGKEGKTRSFEAVLLGHVTANALWDGGVSGKAHRPVWAQFAASDGACMPFLANIRTGRKVVEGRSTEYEFLKSAGYHFLSHRVHGGSLITAYLPDLFRADPGMVDPGRVAFVMMPSQAWITEQSKHLDFDAAIAHASKLWEPRDLGIIAYRRWGEPEPDTRPEFESKIRELLPLASLFCLYLDRRTRCPIIPDMRFQLQVLVSALSNNLAAFPGDGYYDEWGKYRPFGFRAEVDDRLGYASAIACRAFHDQIEALLATEVARYFEALESRSSISLGA